jgi:plasmid stability protein
MARKQPVKGPGDMPATETQLRAVRLELPENAHKLLRLEAAKQDKSLSQMARDIVEGYLLGRPKATGKAKGE